MCCASTLRAQRLVLGLEPPLAQRVAHDQHRLLERQRLLDEVERAHLDGAHRRLDVAVAGDHDDLRFDLPLAHPRERGEAVHAGQPDVEHDDVVGLAAETLEAGFAAVDGVHLVALVAQHAAERAANAGFVVNEQDRWHVVTSRVRERPCRSLGSSTAKRVPRGTLSVTSMLPPCSATMRRTIARPRPLPRRLVE